MLDWRSQVRLSLSTPCWENGYLPVVSSIGVTDEGQLMNVNADQAATALAATLGADLIFALRRQRHSRRQRATYCRNDRRESRTTDLSRALLLTA
ncbi:acetylglutamate kinase [Escherichia coli]|nr:acetylglutamate kinase [Escherichia coli]